MTEFFQPTTHVRADWEWVSYVHRTCRTQSNRLRTFKQNPRDKPEAVSEMLISELGISEEQIAKVRILNEK